MQFNSSLNIISKMLIWGDYWFLWALLIFTLIYLWRALSDFYEIFQDVRRIHWIMLAFLILIATSIRANPELWQHNVFDDEYVHLQLAYNLGHNFRFAFSDLSTNYTQQFIIPPWQPGFHFFIGNIFLIFGYSQQTAFLFNALALFKVLKNSLNKATLNKRKNNR